MALICYAMIHIIYTHSYIYMTGFNISQIQTDWLISNLNPNIPFSFIRLLLNVLHLYFVYTLCCCIWIVFCFLYASWAHTTGVNWMDAIVLFFFYFFLTKIFFLFTKQIWHQQINEGSIEAPSWFDQYWNSEFARSIAASAIDATTFITIATNGIGLRLRKEGKLFPTRWVIHSFKLNSDINK